MNARALSLALIFATIFGFGAANAQGPDKYALLVAVNEYEHSHFSDLLFPEADATAIGEVLKKNGYEVEILRKDQASKKGIETALEELRKRGGNGGVAFIGIFGHGVEFEDNDKSYFCPWDCQIRQSEDLDGKKLFKNNEQPLLEPDRESLVAIDDYIAALRDSRAANRILIADCCRDDPNRARSRSFGSSMKVDALPGNTAVFFACSKNEKAYEEPGPGGKHGVFTKCLLEPLKEGQSLMSGVAAKVAPAVHDMAEKVRKHGEPEQNPSFFQTGARVDLLFKPIDTSRSQKMERQADGTRIAKSIDLKLIPIPYGPKVLGYEYSLGKFEVTQRQYTEVMGTNPSRNQPRDRSGDDLPVERVSFSDANKFCKRLTEMEDKAGRVPEGMVYRLPWMNEWKLASGESLNSLTVEKLKRIGWFGKGAANVTSRKVVLAEQNPLGLHDLFGNVAELCLDHDPKEDTRVAVGGSFSVTPETFLERSKEINAPGFWLDPTAAWEHVGFRVVLGPPADKESAN
jgi:hypothetical protein